MDFRRLKTFFALARLGSLTRASEQLHTAQPALSRQIRMLEEELRVSLFIRHSRGMELTAAGRALVSLASGPMRQLEMAIDQVCELGTDISGHVALGVLPSLAESLACPVAARVAERLPNVALRMMDGRVANLVEGLVKGDLDATFSYSTPNIASIRADGLLTEDLLLVGPRGSDLALDKPVSCKTLGTLDLVLTYTASGLRKQVEQAAAGHGVTLAIKVETDAFSVLKGLVARGLGFTIMPMSAVMNELARGELAAAPLEDPVLTRQLILLQAADREQTRAVRAVIDIIHSEMAALITSGAWLATLSPDLVRRCQA